VQGDIFVRTLLEKTLWSGENDYRRISFESIHFLFLPFFVRTIIVTSLFRNVPYIYAYIYIGCFCDMYIYIGFFCGNDHCHTSVENVPSVMCVCVCVCEMYTHTHTHTHTHTNVPSVQDMTTHIHVCMTTVEEIFFGISIRTVRW